MGGAQRVRRGLERGLVGLWEHGLLVGAIASRKVPRVEVCGVPRAQVGVRERDVAIADHVLPRGVEAEGDAGGDEREDGEQIGLVFGLEMSLLVVFLAVVRIAHQRNIGVE